MKNASEQHDLIIAPTGQRPLRIRKLSRDLRKPVEQIRLRTLIHRLKYDSQLLRSALQWIFFLLVLWIGLEFHYFV